jgi:hypothetical protein
VLRGSSEEGEGQVGPSTYRIPDPTDRLPQLWQQLGLVQHAESSAPSNATGPEESDHRKGRRQATFTEVGVLFFLGSRMGSRSVISFHLLPSLAWERKIMKSSSIVNGEWSIVGLRYSFHLSRHCLALQAVRCGGE